MDWARLNDWLNEVVAWLAGDGGSVTGEHVTITVRPSGGAPILVGPADRVLIGPSEDERGAEQTVPPLIVPETPVVIEVPSRSAWDEYGWTEHVAGVRRIYDGHYQTRVRSGTLASFPGRIVVQGDSVTPYIADPPVQIKRHPKGPCFQLTQPPWFRVHWHKPAHNVDDALLYVQRILHEVLN